MQNKKFIKLFIFIILAIFIVGLFVYFVLPLMENQVEYNSEAPVVVSGDSVTNKDINTSVIPTNNTSTLDPIAVTHIDTPSEVKAIYFSSWVAGSPKIREKLIDMIDKTELNAVVIDVKDSTGRVSFDMAVPAIQKEGSIEKRISNIRSLTDMLHKKNIYIIGRVSVF